MYGVMSGQPHRRRNSFALFSVVLCSILSVMGCSSPERVEITQIRQRSALRPAPRLNVPDDVRFRFASGFAAANGVQPPAAVPAVQSGSTGAPQLMWKTPESWEELPPTQFRNPNFRTGSEQVECYVSVLPGLRGGLLDNANRWRSQMGLSGMSAAEFDALPQVKLAGTSARVLDVEGEFKGMNAAAVQPGFRLRGVLGELNGSGVFAKIVGPSAAVDAEIESFDRFISSLQEKVATVPVVAQNRNRELPSGHPPLQTLPAKSSTPAQVVPGLNTPPTEIHQVVRSDGAIEGHGQGLAWTVPAGWESRDARPMRLVTYSPGGDDRVECYVTLLGSQAGGVLNNVNRWLHQFGNPPMTEEALTSLPTLTLLGQTVHIVEAYGPYTAMDNSQSPDYGLRAVAWVSERGSAFVKMVGPRALVEREAENFVAFCASFRWQG